MTSIRLIPCLDIKDGRVVKGVNFVGLRDAGDPVELAKFYGDEGADELVFLDITASSDARAPVIELAERVAAGPSAGTRASKETMDAQLSMTLEDALGHDARVQAALMTHPDFREAHRAFKEKRPARYGKEGSS